LLKRKKFQRRKFWNQSKRLLPLPIKRTTAKKGQIIKAKLDPKTGKAEFWQVKLVVDKSLLYSKEELEKLKTMPPEI